MKKNVVRKQINCPLCFEKNNLRILDVDKFNLYLCNNCKNGFVAPIPKNISDYYPRIYWQNLGRFSSFRQTLHNSFQKTRSHWFKKYISKGSILDVGSGEGMFGTLLGSNFQVTNLEYPGAKVKNKDVIKVDFLKWKTNKKFDAIVFLESLEHITNPTEYLKKAASLLKKDGLVFVEYPRFGSLESKLLGKNWLQRDIPRHLFHFTEQGLRHIAKNAGFKVIIQREVMSFQYSPYCLLASIGQRLNMSTLNLRLGMIKNFPKLLFLTIGAPLAFIAEILFYLIGESPLGLTILRKRGV